MRSVEEELAIDDSYQHISEALSGAEDAEVPGDDHDGAITAEGSPLDLEDKQPSDVPAVVRKLLLDGLSQRDVADRFGGVSATEVGRVARGDRTSGYNCEIPPITYDKDIDGYRPVDEAVNVDDQGTLDSRDDVIETPTADDLELVAEEVRRVETVVSGDVDVALDTSEGVKISVQYGIGHEL
jgi:hypothetical protein